MKTVHLVLVCAFLFLILPHGLNAQPFPLEKVSVVAGGGGQSSIGTIDLHDTVGETFIGEMTTPTHACFSGYWRMADRIHIGPTSAVLLNNFALTHSLDGVTLTWSIQSADGLIGFQIYRSKSSTHGFSRVNDELIAADQRHEYLDNTVRPGTIYYYRLAAIDRDGEYLSPLAKVTVPRGEVTLFQNYPNPFNPTTTISFYLPEPTRAALAIFDARGKRVRTLLDDRTTYGKHDIEWDGRNDRGDPISSGIYFYRFETNKRVITKKLTLLK